jgi:hypothetical protein
MLIIALPPFYSEYGRVYSTPLKRSEPLTARSPQIKKLTCLRHQGRSVSKLRGTTLGVSVATCLSTESICTGSVLIHSNLRFFSYPLTETTRVHLHARQTRFNDQLRGELRQIDERGGFQPLTFSLWWLAMCVLFPFRALYLLNSFLLCQIRARLSTFSDGQTGNLKVKE